MRFLLGLILLSSSLQALVVLPADRNVVKTIVPDYYVTKEASVSFETASKNLSWFNESKGHNYGLTEGEVWLTFEVQNNSSRGDWQIVVPISVLTHVDFWRQQSGEKFEKTISGAAVPGVDKEHKFRYPMFDLKVEPGGRKRYFFRVRTAGAVNIPLRIWNKSYFERRQQINVYWLGFYYGIMIAMFLYNLMLFISIRDRVFLYYILYIVSYVFFQLTINGVGAQHLWPEVPEFNLRAAPIFSLLTTFLAAKFSINYLMTSRHAPLLHKIIWGSMIVTLLFLPLVILVDLNYAIIFANVIPLLGVGLIIVAGVRCAVLGYRPARYFLIAWFALIIGVVVLILHNLGFIEFSFFSAYAIQIGSALEVLLLSLGLGDRFNTLAEAKEQAQQNLIESQQHAIEKEKHMAESFSRFVPRQFLNYLNKDSILDIIHGDAIRKDMTVLFNDIRNFTTISEQLNSSDTFKFLNRYLETLEPAIKAHNGFIDKFIGDAIMALFPEHARDSLMAAISMRESLTELNQSLNEPIDMGIGLHRGELILGTVGSANRLDTTVIGDTVNLAARIESLTKSYGLAIMISDSVYKEVNDSENFLTREIDSVQVKGRQTPVVLYEVFNTDHEELKGLKSETRADFQMALFQFKARNFAEARDMFTECSQRAPEDSMAKIYINRCDKLIEAPPPESWLGVSRTW